MELKELANIDRFLQLRPYILEAGKKIIALRDDPGFKVMIKPDDSPVTNADIWANHFFYDILSELFPEDSVIGEESEDKNYTPGVKSLWYIDPIDGTKNFVKGFDNFFILLGFCKDGVPSLGIYYKPVTQEFIVGETSKGVFYLNGNQDPVALKASRWPDEQPSLILKRVNEELKDQLRQQFQVQRHHYIYDKVEMLGPLFGESNGYISMRKTAFWDLCAPAAIMRSAGFELAHDADGQQLLFNSGSYQTDYFYALPSNAPADIKKLLFQYQS